MGRIFDFIANTSDGVFAVDRQQVIVLWNDGASAMLGFRPEEVLGEKCYKVIQGRDAEGCVVCRSRCEAFTLAEKLGTPSTMEISSRTKDGDDIWLSLSTIVVPSRRKDLSVLIHLFRDVTRGHNLKRIVQDFAEVVSESSTRPRVRPSRGRATSTEPIELTRREREVLSHVAAGVSTEKIADRLCISPSTVRNHVTAILGKLGVHSRLEAVTYSIRNGLV